MCCGTSSSSLPHKALRLTSAPIIRLLQVVKWHPSCRSRSAQCQSVVVVDVAIRAGHNFPRRRHLVRIRQRETRRRVVEVDVQVVVLVARRACALEARRDVIRYHSTIVVVLCQAAWWHRSNPCSLP